MIEGIVWDVGGILYLTPFEVFPELESAQGLAKGTLPRGPFGAQEDRDYEAVRVGDIDESEYYRRRQEELWAAGIEVDFRHDIDWGERLRPEVMKVIDTLRGRFRQIALTNDASQWLGDGWWEAWPYREMLDGIIDVATLGVRKPDPEPYLLAAERIAVPPERCLYIDDLPINCRGAEEVRMTSFLFDVTDPPGSIDRLMKSLDEGSRSQDD